MDSMPNTNNQIAVRRDDSELPETLVNKIYLPAFIRSMINKIVKVSFLIGANTLVYKVGRLTDVGSNYIVLKSLFSDNMLVGDMYSIKFINVINSPMAADFSEKSEMV